MILAAPLVIPFAEAVGISIATLGMAKAADMVNDYIQENPEQSAMILKTLVPNLGIGEIFMKKDSGDEEVSEDIDVEVEEKPKKLSGKEKGMRIKEAIRRARAGRGNYSSPDAEGSAVDIRGSVIREVEDMGIADKDLKDNYNPDKPKFDYKKFFRNRKADGGSVGIEILFGPKRDNFRYGGDTMGGRNDRSRSSPGPDRSRVSAQQESNHGRAMAAAQSSGGGISYIPPKDKENFLDKIKNTTDKIVDNPLTKFLDPRSKIALAMGGYKFLRDGIPNYQDDAINQELEKIPTMGGISRYADGGRVGLFMGGSPLEGQALSIYNSMNAYGFDDQAIANALTEQGLYTAPGSSTPETTAPNIINQQLQTVGGGDNNFGGQGIGAFGNLDPNTKKTMQVEVADGMGGVTIKEVDTYLDAGGLRKTLDNKNPVNAGIDIKPMAVGILEALMGKKTDDEFDPAGKIYGTFNNPNYKDLSFFGKIKADYSRQKELKQLQKEFELQEKLKAQIAEEQKQAAFDQARLDRDRAVSSGLDAAIREGRDTSGFDRPDSGAYAEGAGMGVGGGYASDFGFLKDGGLATMFKEKR